MQFPAGLALLLPAFPPERRGMAVGIWGATGALAAALGPTIGAILINAFGWRSVFLVNVPVALLAIAAGAAILQESRSDDLPERVDPISVPMASIGVGLLVLAIAQTESWGFVSVPTLLTVLGSAVLLGSGIAHLGPASKSIANVATSTDERDALLTRAIDEADAWQLPLWSVLCRIELHRTTGDHDLLVRARQIAAGTELEGLDGLTN